MKKIISLLIAIVMVVCMSSVAFASSLSANDDIVTLSADIINLNITHAKLNTATIDFLKKWVASDANVLFVDGSSSSFIVYFAIVPLTSHIKPSYANNYGYSFSEDIRILSISSFSDSVGLFAVPANSHALPSSSRPLIASGSYFLNTNNNFNQSLANCLASKKYTIKDFYGIFNGWKSSLGGSVLRRTLSINYKYKDGTVAAPTFFNIYAVGDSYSIPSPVIDGYVANIAVVSGDNIASNLTYSVVYSKIKTCDIAVIYQYEDGGQAFPPFGQTFNIGDSYSITSPLLDGYIPSASVLSGIVTDSMSPFVSFTVVYSVDCSVISSSDFNLFLDFILESSGLFFVVGFTIFGLLLSVRFIVKVLGFLFG